MFVVSYLGVFFSCILQFRANFKLLLTTLHSVTWFMQYFTGHPLTFITKIHGPVAFCTVRMSELCNHDVIVTVRIFVVFVECHQVFCACKFMLENIIDFETCRKLQGPFILLLVAS
jgi:hypothetical protein